MEFNCAFVKYLSAILPSLAICMDHFYTCSKNFPQKVPALD